MRLSGFRDFLAGLGFVRHVSRRSLRRRNSTRPTPQVESLEVRLMLTTFYVDDDAPDGGDGSQEAPFRLVRSAAAAASQSDAEDDTILLLPGTYNENVFLGSRSGSGDVALRGETGVAADVQIIGTTSSSNVISVYLGNNVTIADVTVSGGRDGIHAEAANLPPAERGSLAVEGVVSTENSLSGLAVIDGGDVTIRDSELSRNGTFGAFHLRVGRVDVDGLVASDNRSGAGIRIQNGGDVTITDAQLAGNTGSGLAIINSGAATITDSSLTDNGDNGAFLIGLPGATVNGMNSTGNTDNGLYFERAGDVVVTDTTTAGNGRDGLFTVNTTSVTVSGLTATGNSLSGFSTVNTAFTNNVRGAVSVSDSRLVDNSSNGIFLQDVGNVSIADSTLTGNIGFGTTSSGSGAYMFRVGNVSVSGTTASDNGRDGVFSRFAASVMVTGLTASDNTLSGVSTMDAAGEVAVSDSMLTGNGHHGVFLLRTGAVDIDEITATGNARNGVHAVSVASLTLTDSVLDGNGFSSQIGSNQTLVSYNGIFLNNTGGTVLADSSFSGNAGNGVNYRGDISTLTLTGVDVSGNGTGTQGRFRFPGLFVGFTEGVSVTGSQFNGNGWDGMQLHAFAPIDLVDVTANDNGRDGLISDGLATVTITGGEFSRNAVHGLNFEEPPPGSPGLNGLTLRDVTASQNGSLTAATSTGGAGLRVFSRLNGAVLIEDSVFAGNVSPLGGGGIEIIMDNTGGTDVTIRNTQVTNNVALGGGGLRLTGSGNYVIEDSLIAGNTAARDDSQGNPAGIGGGIALLGGWSLSLARSTVDGNSANGGGGGIFASTSTPERALVIEQSTISNNTSGGGGGGGITALAATEIVNSTISGNTTTGDGGGLQMLSNTNDARLVSTTITGNSAGGVGGGVDNQFPTFELLNTIIAGNTAGQGSPDFDGPAVSLGHNLIGNRAGMTGDLDGGTFQSRPSDIVGTPAGPVDPRLAPLADNGGPTRTHALQVDSPAINAGAESVPAVDQRGVARPQLGAVDIGAFELVNRPPQANDDSATTAEDVAVTIDVLANDSDPDGDALIVVAATTPENGTVTINADGTLTYTPAVDFSGTDTFTYTIADNFGAETTATVTVTVVSRQQQIDALIAAVEQLATDGVLGNGQANQLVSPLKLNGPTHAILSRLDRFAERVQRFLGDGILTEAQAAPLLAAVETLRTSVSVTADGEAASDPESATPIEQVFADPDTLEEELESSPKKGHGKR